MTPEEKRQRARERHRKYYEANRERILERNRAQAKANPGKITARVAAWNKANPERARALRLKANLKHKYGITPADFSRMVTEQAAQCACCRDALDFLRPHTIHIDHCHATGRIRGVLCHSCNKMLGHAKDEIKRLAAAIEFFARQPKRRKTRLPTRRVRLPQRSWFPSWRAPTSQSKVTVAPL